jgi:hypothetical protein
MMRRQLITLRDGLTKTNRKKIYYSFQMEKKDMVVNSLLVAVL